MSDTPRTPIETSAGELRRWLHEERNVGPLSAGLVGPIANFIGADEVIYRDAVMSLEPENYLAGRIVVFTTSLVIDAVIQPTGRDAQGDSLGTVSIRVQARSDLEQITSADEHLIKVSPYNQSPPRWPYPITAELHYKGDVVIPQPLDPNRRYYSTWTSELLPALIGDLGA